MAGFWGYFGGTIVRPRRTFERLMADPRKVSLGFKAMLFIGVLYTGAVAALAAAGGLPPVPVLLPLAPENYYFYEIFFALPIFLSGWILASGFSRFGFPGRQKKGSFAKTLAAFGFAFAIPSLGLWIPETIFAASLLSGMKQEEFVERASQPGFWQFFVLGFQAVYVAWALALVITAVAVGRKERRARAVLVGSATMVLFLALMIVFIR